MKQLDIVDAAKEFLASLDATEKGGKPIGEVLLLVNQTWTEMAEAISMPHRVALSQMESLEGEERSSGIGLRAGDIPEVDEHTPVEIRAKAQLQVTDRERLMRACREWGIDSERISDTDGPARIVYLLLEALYDSLNLGRVGLEELEAEWEVRYSS